MSRSAFSDLAVAVRVATQLEEVRATVRRLLGDEAYRAGVEPLKAFVRERAEGSSVSPFELAISMAVAADGRGRSSDSMMLLAVAAELADEDRS